MSGKIGLLLQAASGPAVLHELSGVIARHQGDITSVEIVEQRSDGARIYFEIDLPADAAALLADMEKLGVVREVRQVNTFEKIYGKRPARC